MRKLSYPALALSSLLTTTSPAYAITADELAEQFEAYKVQQAEEFNKLRQENEQLKSTNSALKQQLDNTSQQVENNTLAVEVISDEVESTEASTGSNWYDRTTIGGYGELHYGNYDSSDPGQQVDVVDFHRFVLFFGHEFTDNLRFFSEIELEHAITGDGWAGEVELEQAYIEYDITEQASAKAGLYLVPIGIMNETHEPPTFYGVERNDVEKYIIPSTWWEAGLGARYHFDNGIGIQAGVTSGLNAANGYIRGARGKLSKQLVKSGAVYGGLKYTGLAGLELAANFNYQMDMDQGVGHTMGGGVLSEFHAIYSHALGPGTAMAKALYSRWDISKSAYSGAGTQYGWYIEPSYRIPTFLGDVGAYGRYQQLAYYKNSKRTFGKWELGLNYWPHENVVVKFDYFEKNPTDGS
ncbi:MAG: porin, partial [Methyloprofundus sp.]|nr:porin [Methyloprofundus sp.]